MEQAMKHYSDLCKSILLLMSLNGCGPYFVNGYEEQSEGFADQEKYVYEYSYVAIHYVELFLQSTQVWHHVALYYKS